jgi:hypothetical protein
VSRHRASFCRALILLPALASPMIAHASTPPPDPAPPRLVSPLLPPLELSAMTPVREPVAGEDYLVNVSVTNIGGSLAENVRLSLRLSPDLTLPRAPAGCAETYGIPAPALDCYWARLAPGHSVIVPLIVRAISAYRLVAVGSIVRYDWGLWAYANIIRVVLCGPPPPPPPPSPSPPPVHRTPPPVHRSPAPPPRHPKPAPRRPVRHASPAPPKPARPAPSLIRKAAVPPPAAPKHRRPPKPSPKPVPFNRVEELPLIPEGNPKPVIPLGILIAVVLTPCVAAAATRFGKR